MSGGVWITRTCLEAVQLLDRGKVKKRESVDGQKRKKKKIYGFCRHLLCRSGARTT